MQQIFGLPTLVAGHDPLSRVVGGAALQILRRGAIQVGQRFQQCRIGFSIGLHWSCAGVRGLRRSLWGGSHNVLHGSEIQQRGLADLFGDFLLIHAGDGHHNRGIVSGTLRGDFGFRYPKRVHSLPDDFHRLLEGNIGNCRGLPHGAGHQSDLRAALEVQAEPRCVLGTWPKRPHRHPHQQDD